MIAVLAGRRIDEANASYKRFPLSEESRVKEKLKKFLTANDVSHLVCSGACGADLLAIQVAGEMGISRTMVIPFDPDTFRKKSVVDRPGKNWESIYNTFLQEASASGGKDVLKILKYNESDPDAYAKTNLEVLKVSESLKKEKREEVLAVVVWEGTPKNSDDSTNNFRLEAERRGLPIEVIKTIQTTADIKLDLIKRTREYLRGKALDDRRLKELYIGLETWDQFAYAAEMLFKQIELRQGAPVLRDQQRLAKLIYKDHSLPSSFKYDRALRELGKADNLNTTKNCETLGLAGAIYKYRWIYDHQPKNLELSIYYYGRGYASWRSYISSHDPVARSSNEKLGLNDWGYTAVNYAYMMELTAIDRIEALGKSKNVIPAAEAEIAEANEVRKFIIDQFVDDSGVKLNREDYYSWVPATVAEAYFGLRQYEKAKEFIRIYKDKEKIEKDADNREVEVDEKVVAWKTRTFMRQLLSIAYLQHMELERATEVGATPDFIKGINREAIMDCLKVLGEARREEPTSIEVSNKGKTGLALSGGGVRAALFHIGVLAALAERDKLKDIEVISCVSGGSIVGTYYYLELKKELERERKDNEKTIDYVEIVKKVEKNFLKGVQKNLRMRVISSLRCNLRMLVDKNYSRTHRLGELYEEHLYSGIDEKHKGPVYMNHLFIKPFDSPDGFNIDTDNFNRKYKVPQLILNATAVNTGHNWQFTASWMGEPPGNIQADIDVKPRLRRMYYADAPDRYKNFRLGYAVAASSCVPVLFTPMPLYGLYPDDEQKEIALQLIDGGLHDNQGIASLIEQECKNMIISDASGQMATTTDSVGNELSVFFRADTILQERIRELQFKDLKERAYTAQINELVSLHLKSGLDQPPISWKKCTDPPRKIYDRDKAKRPDDLMDYGILSKVQQWLSEIRTDLDSFSDVESWALMYSGYEQTHYQYDQREPGQFRNRKDDWKFLQIKEYVTDPTKADEIKKVLVAARKVPFKLLELSPVLKYLTYAVLGVIAIGILTYGVLNWGRCVIGIGELTFIFLVLLVGIFWKDLAMLLNIKATIRNKIIWVVTLTLAAIAGKCYLLFFNNMYNNFGKLKKK